MSFGGEPSTGGVNPSTGGTRATGGSLSMGRNSSTGGTQLRVALAPQAEHLARGE